MKGGENKETAKQSGAGGQPAIHWDESNARTITPRTCTVHATPEEFSLIFVEGSPQPAGHEQAGPETRRIILNPFLAKRVAAQLNEVVRQYELRFGVLEEFPAHPATARGFPFSEKQFLGIPAILPDRGQDLFELVTSFNVKTSFEHSFKVSEGCLLDNRFLLGINRQGGDGRQDENVKQLCARLDMPAGFAGEFRRLLPSANHVYFGFEENQDGALYKVYLEFRDRAEERIRAGSDSRTPLLLFLGFKWDCSDNGRSNTTRYEWYPNLSVRDIMERLPAMLARGPGRDCLSIAEAVIGLASERLEPRDIQYVEVSEEGNPRNSFDINLYKARIRLKELEPFFMRMAEYYDLDPVEFRIFCAGIESKLFGHLAGGIDRRGRDFMTVYYGVEYIGPQAGNKGWDVFD